LLTGTGGFGRKRKTGTQKKLVKGISILTVQPLTPASDFLKKKFKSI
jgi:hypothetical protein